MWNVEASNIFLFVFFPSFSPSSFIFRHKRIDYGKQSPKSMYRERERIRIVIKTWYMNIKQWWVYEKASILSLKGIYVYFIWEIKWNANETVRICFFFLFGSFLIHINSFIFICEMFMEINYQPFMFVCANDNIYLDRPGDEKRERIKNEMKWMCIQMVNAKLTELFRVSWNSKLAFLGSWNAIDCFVERSLIENSNEKKANKKKSTHTQTNDEYWSESLSVMHWQLNA